MLADKVFLIGAICRKNLLLSLEIQSYFNRRIVRMLTQEIFSALAFAFLIGVACLGNYLTHHINVEVLSEGSEVNVYSSFALKAF